MTSSRSLNWIVGILMLGLAGCNWVPGSDEARRRLIGKYDLLVSNDCADRDIQSDTLELREDGTYVHEVLLKKGQSFREEHSGWKYSDGSLFLGNYRDFTGNRSPWSTPGEGGGSFVLDFGIGFSNDPTILLHPDMNCAYIKRSR